MYCQIRASGAVAGHIGACANRMPPRNLQSRTIGQAHGIGGGLNLLDARDALLDRGAYHAGAEGFGKQQHLVRQATLIGKHLALGDFPGDRQAKL